MKKETDIASLTMEMDRLVEQMMKQTDCFAEKEEEKQDFKFE